MARIPNDPYVVMTGHDRGTNDNLSSSDSPLPLVGDAARMNGSSAGGNDTITALGDAGTHLVFGDAVTMDGASRGGADLLIGGNGLLLAIDFPDGTGEIVILATRNYLTGDAAFMLLSSRGGNDTLLGGSLAENYLSGDALSMQQTSRGGNDRLVGGLGGRNVLTGDSGKAFDTYDDAVIGMLGHARGGNDVLIAGGFSADADAYGTGLNFNILIGDSLKMSDDSVAGKDKLISGSATDQMWGDAQILGNNVTTAADTFVFNPDSGNDTIFDFRQSDHDRIDVRAYGFDQLADMVITGNVIGFGDGNGVTLDGFATTLTASDFIFA